MDDRQKACAQALIRFRQYRDLPRGEADYKRRMNEYRDWFLAHGRTAAEIEAVAERVVNTFRKCPNIAELNDVWNELHPAYEGAANAYNPPPEEAAERRTALKAHYASEAEGIEARKAAFRRWQEEHPIRPPARPIAPMVHEPPPITQADIDRILAEIDANRKKKENPDS